MIRPEIAGTVLLLLAGITLLSLFTPNQSVVIATWLDFLELVVGWGQYVIWLPLFFLAIWFFRAYRTEDEAEQWEKPLGTFILLGLLLILFHLAAPGDSLIEPGGGGMIGWMLGELLRSALGTAGAVVFVVAFMPLVVILISGLSLQDIFVMLRDQYYRYQDWRHFRELTINQPGSSPTGAIEQKSKFLNRILPGKSADTEEKEPLTIIGQAKVKPASPESRSLVPADQASADLVIDGTTGDHKWRLPPIAQIFEEGIEREISEAEIRRRVKVIEETLMGFGVEVKVREINQGPAVTQFSLEPGYMATKDAKGNPKKVRVSRIVNLSNDLALALSASPIRIEAPIPGRPYVGLEVPNSSTNVVTLRNLMESDKFHRSRGQLKLALGQDVSGNPVVTDLTTMPHLLIAGATGSGKSVCINAVVACMLSTHTPDTLRLLMVDPKMVELVAYNGIPHLLAPVVTDLERVVGVLNWATREMERRYKLLSKEGVRNIIGYNEKVAKTDDDPLPYIVIIIDELADLMMMAPDEVERAITRIAQMARAVGMHLILATQRPSVNVVTGLIKANFPARVAFAVSSQIDSRVILDTPGAERLLGKGDMLYMAPDASKLQRLQGVFVSDKELNHLVRFWKGLSSDARAQDNERRTSTDVPDNLVQQPLWGAEYKEIEKAIAQTNQDDMLEKAVELVRNEGRASVSFLQRRLRVGYARAARLIDEMEEQGIIGPDEGGGKARPILITQEDDEADPTADEE